MQVAGMAKRNLKKISLHHSIDWDEKFPSVKVPSPSKYLLYSRNQYMQQMSTADEPD